MAAAELAGKTSANSLIYSVWLCMGIAAAMCGLISTVLGLVLLKAHRSDQPRPKWLVVSFGLSLVPTVGFALLGVGYGVAGGRHSRFLFYEPCVPTR